MSQNTYFYRDYSKTNLIEDIVEFFPKMGGPINIPRSDGSFTYGVIVQSNFFENKYAIYASKINKWFIQVYFVSNDQYIYKYIATDDLIFSNFSQNEIQNIINMSKVPNELFFNDKKDPEQWMAKKTVLKQLAKLMPKDDDRLKKAVSMDDNIEGGGYLIMDDNDTVRFVQGNIIGKKSSIYAKLMEKNVPEDLLMENNDVDL